MGTTQDINVKPCFSDGASSTVLAISNKCKCWIHIVSLPFTLPLIIVDYNGPKTVHLYIYKRPFHPILLLELLERRGSLCQYELAQVTTNHILIIFISYFKKYFKSPKKLCMSSISCVFRCTSTICWD